MVMDMDMDMDIDFDIDKAQTTGTQTTGTIVKRYYKTSLSHDGHHNAKSGHHSTKRK